ncbi:MAG: rhodanese-like domain-containing protein [Saprospiraceae bacterium]
MSQLDLAYAPPFSPAKDPLVVASFVSENIIKDKCSQISTDEYKAFVKSADENYILLDVRNNSEFEEGHIPGAINIPLHQLRNSIGQLDCQKKIIIYCQKGLRGYVGRLILKNNNYKNVVSISGGYKIWKMKKEDITLPRLEQSNFS